MVSANLGSNALIAPSQPGDGVLGSLLAMGIVPEVGTMRRRELITLVGGAVQHLSSHAHDVERHCLMCVATEATNFEITTSSVERLTERGRWLRFAFVAERPLLPSSQARRLDFLRASRARLPNARIELPYIDLRDLMPMAGRMRPQGGRFTGR